jgi:hypothetical protein
MSMTTRSQRSDKPARPARVSRRRAQQARAQLAAGGLSHQERRRLRADFRLREDAVRRRRRRLKHLVITVTGAVVAMAITALAFGLVPAIKAADGEGTTGSFVVTHQVCSSKTGCQWVGTFQAGDGPEIGVAYGGVLPAGDGPGSTISVRYTGGSTVYALHGSHTWVLDLLVTLVLGAAAGAGLWISPLGDGGGDPEGVRTSA